MNNIIEVFCDGSCKASDPQRVGAYCAVIRLGNEELEVVCGTANNTTISIMEIEAVSHGIRHILLNKDNPKYLMPEIEGVKIYSDSEYVVRCSTGEYKIKANTEVWDALKLYTRQLTKASPYRPLWLEIGHISRNTLEECAQADYIVDELRKTSELAMERIVNTKGYKQGKLAR